MDESAGTQPSFLVDEDERGINPWTLIGIIVLPILLAGGFFGYKYGMSQWHISKGDAAVIKRDYQTAQGEYDAARELWDDGVVEEKLRSVRIYIELSGAAKKPR